MKPELFKTQIDRLKTEWPNAYGKERMLVLWDKFKNERDSDFIEAVSLLLFNHKGQAPVGRDFEDAIRQAKSQRWMADNFEKAKETESQVQAEALKLVNIEPVKPLPPPTPEEIAMSAAERRKALDELYAKLEIPRETEAPKAKHERMRKQIRLIGRELATGERE